MTTKRGDDVSKEVEGEGRPDATALRLDDAHDLTAGPSPETIAIVDRLMRKGRRQRKVSDDGAARRDAGEESL